ncbi:MAG: hypothetical protein JNK87_10490 [Bryobacterales bacterium]|nr:hypothetical protein [Bryobacterales bacterium]
MNRLRDTLLLAGALALGIVLLAHSARTFRALERERQTYLRTRLAALAEQIESQPTELPEEPGLLGFSLLHRSPGPSPLDAVWEGRELFRTEAVSLRGITAVRAFVPIHGAEEELQIAQLDLAANAADFLVAEARGNLQVATGASIALLALAAYAVFSSRRAARLQTAQAQLEHFARLGQMSAVLAHEIRNPLGTIKGFAQLLDEKASPDDRALIAPIVSESTRLEALVNDLLLYGRPPHVQPRTVHWSEIEAGLTHHLRQAVDGTAVHFTADSADFPFTTDPALLQQALLNLLRNAVEAIPPATAGNVTLRATAAPSQVCIEVTDTGPGLSSEAAASLFQPFFTTKVSGTGLGLAITRKLIASLGGSLNLESPAAGGTLATILLPLQAPHGTPPVS